MTKLLGAIVIVLMISAFVLAATDPQNPVKLNQALDEANKSFTYNGKPINPRAVQELLSWPSDSGPGPVSIDVAGTDDTNRYYGDYEKKEDGSVFIKLDNDSGGGYFIYERLGTLKDNIHVVETSDNGGGSGIFMNLLLIQFKIDFEYGEDGSHRYMLIMQRLGQIMLCDRYDGPIQIRSSNNSIEIGPGTCGANDKFARKIIPIN
ncbi:hypothetical protein L0244_07390 [bacterium]|nr:hypothetical protein [bacterium]